MERLRARSGPRAAPHAPRLLRRGPLGTIDRGVHASRLAARVLEATARRCPHGPGAAHRLSSTAGVWQQRQHHAHHPTAERGGVRASLVLQERTRHPVHGDVGRVRSADAPRLRPGGLLRRHAGCRSRPRLDRGHCRTLRQHPRAPHADGSDPDLRSAGAAGSGDRARCSGQPGASLRARRRSASRASQPVARTVGSSAVRPPEEQSPRSVRASRPARDRLGHLQVRPVLQRGRGSRRVRAVPRVQRRAVRAGLGGAAGGAVHRAPGAGASVACHAGVATLPAR